MPPFFLIDLLGLDTVYHVAEHLNASFGDRFYVHKGMGELVEKKELGAKTGGKGFFENGEPRIPGDVTEVDGEALGELMALKSFVEACLVLEDGLCTTREIDLGLMAGAGMDPRRGLLPPFMKADVMGLDVVLERLEALEEAHGERFAPPTTLKRLVAQGRLGAKSGMGFYAYPQADEGEQAETVKLETREDGVAIAWLANGQVNSISPDVIRDLGTVWEKAKSSGVRALVVASSSPVVFSAGADIKAFTQMDEASGKALVDGAHGLLREMETSDIVTIAAVNSLAFGGGCELAMACDVRIAAQSAIFGQPEIKLGIIPGFGGTQRLPRLVGENKALEMNLIGDAITAEEAYEFGLVNRIVPDHELLETALSWARSSPARPRSPSARSRRSRPRATSTRASRPRRPASPPRSSPRTPRRASPPSSASARRSGRASSTRRRTAARLAELIREAESVVALTGAGISVPSGIPDFRSPGSGLWENVNPMEVAHIDAWRADPGALLALLRQPLPDAARQAAQRRPRRARRARAPRQARRRRHPEHRPAAPPRRHAGARRGPRDDRHVVVPGLRRAVPARGGPAPPRGLAGLASRAATAASRSSPTSSCSASSSPRAPLERAYAMAAGADVLLCVGSSLEVHPIAQLPGVTRQAGGQVAIVTAGPTPGTPAPRSSSTATSSPSSKRCSPRCSQVAR